MSNYVIEDLEIEKYANQFDEFDYFLSKSAITAGTEFMNRFSQVFRTYLI